MKLKIERDGIVLYDGDVDTFEYAEKTDGTVSCVGTPAKPHKAQSNLAEMIKQAGQKLAENQKAKTEEMAASKRGTVSHLTVLPPDDSEPLPTSDEIEPTNEEGAQQT